MDGFRPLQYVEEPVESGLNAPRRPIEPEIYHHYATNLLNSGFHRSVKEDFLWTAFYNVYMEPFIEKHPSWDEFDLGFQKMQAKDFARKDKYLWTHWLLWKRVMMPESLQRADERGVAGELAFTPSYQDLYLAQAASHHGSDCSSKHTSKKQSSAPSVDTLSA
jgi:hypothetical protein